jgi:pilus assembly protein Flp/PilA
MVMLKRFFYEEDGQGMVEYGLIIALVAVVVIVALQALGTGLGDIFGFIKGKLDKAQVE